VNNLDEIRRRWLEERPRYGEYGRLIEQRLSAALKAKGIWFEISSRPKTIESLIKKLIKKPRHSFESIPDKIGVRVIVRYRSDLDVVIQIVTETLHCGPIDPKARENDSVGYLSIHVDLVRLKESDPEQRRFPVNDFWAELQLRTQAQHLWSEMSHDSIYKNDRTILLLSDDIKRRVNLMAGQIEIADREFDRLAGETSSPREAEVLRFLEPFYYRLASAKYDVELSLIILRILLPLFREELPAIRDRISSFLENHATFLRNRYALAQEEDATPVSPLFFQPEALLIYELLSDDEIGLRKAWQAELPPKELESLARDLGISFQ
jgi:ppGpp synthetase/RelA/SpoT-type nucleotidyltranferase